MILQQTSLLGPVVSNPKSEKAVAGYVDESNAAKQYYRLIAQTTTTVSSNSLEIADAFPVSDGVIEGKSFEPGCVDVELDYFSA